MSLSLYPHVGTTGTAAGRSALLLPPFSGEWSAAPPATPPDLVAAVVAQLRSWQGGALAAALGDATATPKIGVDEALFSPAPPWVRVTEIAEPLSPHSADSGGLVDYFGRGMHQVSVFASSKTQARTLRAAVVSALADAPLVFDDGTLLEYRPDGQVSPPAEGVGVGGAKVYHAFATFTYMVMRNF